MVDEKQCCLNGPDFEREIKIVCCVRVRILKNSQMPCHQSAHALRNLLANAVAQSHVNRITSWLNMRRLLIGDGRLSQPHGLCMVLH